MSNAQPIEVQLFDPTAPVTGQLAILEGAANVKWQDLLADVGGASFDLSLYDSKATPQNTQKGGLIKLLLGGVPVFAFFNTSPVLTIGEAELSKWTLAGQSVLSYLGRALAYPPGGVAAPTGVVRSFSAATPGTILKTLIDEAQARGTCPSMTYDFTTTLDSAGNSWSATGVLTINVGATILDVAKKLVALGMGLSMDPNLVLHAYVPGAQGVDLSSTVIWQQGQHIVSPVDNTGEPSGPQLLNLGAGFSTVCLVQGTGGKFVERTDPAYTGNAWVGRWESSLDYSSTSGDTTQMNAAGDQQIALSENASQALTINLSHGAASAGLYEPYQDYHLGDTIAINVPGSYANAPYKIQALTVSQTEGANYDIAANVGSLPMAFDLALAKQATSVSGTTSPISGTIAGDLRLGNPPGGLQIGSTLPAQPAYGNNRPFFYTAAGYNEVVYYDGTRWLSSTLYVGEYTRPRQADFNPIANNFSYDGLFPHPTQSIYMVSLWGWFYVATTNDGTHYWTLSDSVTAVSFNTSAKSPNVWFQLTAAAGTVIAPQSMNVMGTKTSTPGGIYVTVGYTYRKIAT